MCKYKNKNRKVQTISTFLLFISTLFIIKLFLAPLIKKFSTPQTKTFLG